MRKRIAIVVQRYGLEVNGGAEYHARMLAERLAASYHVEVLTTTALDYHTWENHYIEGEDEVNGIKVHRFSTIRSSKRKIRKAHRAITARKKYFKILRAINIFDFMDKQFKLSTPTDGEILDWFIRQGPYCPTMIEYIRTHKSSYDAFIFFTYLYYPTAVGMREVAEKSVFIPTAHNEEIMFAKPYEDIYSIPAFIMYNTVSEKKLIETDFKEVTPKSDIAGVGVERITHMEDTIIPEDYKFNFPYLVYIGRIDKNKGCAELIDYFEELGKERRDLKLVMIGKDFMGVKPSDNIILTGFVEDEVKNQLLENSLGLILPSKYESLSIVTLEAMSEGKVVIVNGECEVLKDHVLNSGTGFYYTSYETFKESLERTCALTEVERAGISAKAKEYVEQNYSWDVILRKFDDAIDYVCSENYC